MNIHISEVDGVPIYLQIVNQIKFLIASGRLSPTDELPPIRSLAEQLTVNPNTVARAYRELELAGVVTKKRTTGTYVSEGASRLSMEECKRILAERIDALLAEAKHMDIDIEDVLDLVRAREEIFRSEVA
ncbi:MAG TPA: GntR family transcriptional regulator [Fimbriimonadaceae bacterium]|nr:GntR family transcriptional regulator [Fimbriimonadaceae bacterium]